MMIVLHIMKPLLAPRPTTFFHGLEGFIVLGHFTGLALQRCCGAAVMACSSVVRRTPCALPTTWRALLLLHLLQLRPWAPSICFVHSVDGTRDVTTTTTGTRQCWAHQLPTPRKQPPQASNQSTNLLQPRDGTTSRQLHQNTKARTCAQPLGRESRSWLSTLGWWLA